MLQGDPGPAPGPHRFVDHPAQRGIPWSNTVATVVGAQRQWLAPQHTTAKWPSCHGDQLTAAPSGAPRGLMGKTIYVIQVVNTSAHSCTLSEHPSHLVGVRADGTRVPLQAPPIDFVTDAYLAPANVGPGHSAWFSIVTGNGCPAELSGRGARYHSVEFEIGSGEPVTASWPGQHTVDLVCGAWLTPFGTLRPQHPAHVRIDALTAHAWLPTTVTAGSLVTYQVTLTNPTDRNIALDDPCPAYTQYLTEAGTSPRSVTGAYLLNCSSAPDIPAHSAVTFNMRIQAPSSMGTATLGWAIPGTTLRTSGTLTVTSATHAPGHAPAAASDGSGVRHE